MDIGILVFNYGKGTPITFYKGFFKHSSENMVTYLFQKDSEQNIKLNFDILSEICIIL